MKTQELGDKDFSPVIKYSESFKRAVVREFEQGCLNKDQIQAKYCIGGNSRVLETNALGRPMKDPQKQRIKDLEKQLEEARLKVLAYEKLIAIAEKEEGISILKKDGARQSASLPKPTQEK